MSACRKGHEFDKGQYRQCPTCKRQNYLDNWDRAQQKNKEWIQNHRERYQTKQKEYRTKNSEFVRGLYREWVAKNPYHSIYRGMLKRCYSEKSDHYKYYGARGIKVCDRWLGDDGYKNFESDIGPRPSMQHSIDRRDNDKDYTPENVKWSTRSEQQRNRRMNRMLTISGRTQCLAAWAEETGIGFKTIDGRINRGWSGSDLIRPVGTRHG